MVSNILCSYCCQVGVLNLMMMIEYKVTENVIIRYDDLLSICDCSIAVSCTIFEIYDVEEFHGHEILN